MNIDYIKNEIKEREELAKSAIQSKENTIDKLQKLKNLVDKKYKNAEKTEIMVKQLFSLYSFCQISDKKINTKEKLIELVDDYCNNEADYEYGEYNKYYGCFGLKEFNDFDESCFTFGEELAKCLENSNMNRKRIYLDYYFYDPSYIQSSFYDDYYDSNKYDETSDPNRVISFDVLCTENSLIKTGVYSYEKIMELILSGKMIITNIKTIGKGKLQPNLTKKLKDGDLWKVSRNEIVNDIKKYSLNSYSIYIQSLKNNFGGIMEVFDNIVGGIWDIDKSKNSEVAQIFPQINQMAFDLIVNKIDKQIAKQSNELVKIKQEYSNFLKSMTSKIKSQQAKDEKSKVDKLSKEITKF